MVQLCEPLVFWVVIADAGLGETLQPSEKCSLEIHICDMYVYWKSAVGKFLIWWLVFFKLLFSLAAYLEIVF